MMVKFEAGKTYQINISATTSGNRDDAHTVVIPPPNFPDVTHGHEWTIDTTQPFSFTVEPHNPDGTRMTVDDFKRLVRQFNQTITATRRLRSERRSVTKR